MSRPFYKNRYFIVGFSLLFWLTFFDQNNFIYQYKLGQQIEELETEKSYYQEQIEKLKEQKELLTNDEDMLERFARETYLMTKEGETLFLLKERD